VDAHRVHRPPPPLRRPDRGGLAGEEAEIDRQEVAGEHPVAAEVQQLADDAVELRLLDHVVRGDAVHDDALRG